MLGLRLGLVLVLELGRGYAIDTSLYLYKSSHITTGHPVVKSIYNQAPVNYFYSKRINTLFEQPKQIMTLQVS